MTAQSPAIDRGIASARNASAPSNDHDGTSRPQGGGIDLGAFESASSTATTTPTTAPPPTTTTPATTTPTTTSPTTTTPTTTTPTTTTPTTTTTSPTNSPVASGIYRINNACTGRPLTLEMQDPGPWGNVIAGRRAESMRWQVDAQPDGRIQLRMPGTDRVVGTAYGETKAGTNVEVWTDWQGDIQRWVPTPTNKERVFTLALAAEPTMALDVDSTGPAPGRNVSIASTQGTCPQQWRFSPGT